MDDEAVARYALRARPCVGPFRDQAKSHKCNHFDLISSLAAHFPHQIGNPRAIIADKDVCGTAREILKGFPFERGFSGLRRRVIVKVLQKRVQFLNDAFERERANEGIFNCI
jgi:hypothetical protein